jgi:integrase
VRSRPACQVCFEPLPGDGHQLGRGRQIPDRAEVDALLACCDQATWTGRRDHAPLLLAVQTGLRISELIGLTCRDVHLGAGPYVACAGKGRKDRITPLTSNTVTVLGQWLAEQGSSSHAEVRDSGRGAGVKMPCHVSIGATYCGIDKLAAPWVALDVTRQRDGAGASHRRHPEGSVFLKWSRVFTEAGSVNARRTVRTSEET